MAWLGLQFNTSNMSVTILEDKPGGDHVISTSMGIQLAHTYPLAQDTLGKSLSCDTVLSTYMLLCE